MRDRNWRRHIEEKIIIKRLRGNILYKKWVYVVIDVNKNWYKKSLIVDFLGSLEYYLAKTTTTDHYASKYKAKWSANKCRNWSVEGKNKFFSRLQQKNLVKKILKENGLK